MTEGLLANISVVWTSITVVLSLAIGLQMGSIFVFKKEAPKYNVQTNSFGDLYFMGVALCFISLYRHLAYSMAKPKVEERMKAVEPGCPDSKIDKNTRAVVGTIWYTFTTVLEDNSDSRFGHFLRSSLRADYFSGRVQVRGGHFKMADVSSGYKHQALLYDTTGPPHPQLAGTHEWSQVAKRRGRDVSASYCNCVSYVILLLRQSSRHGYYCPGCS